MRTSCVTGLRVQTHHMEVDGMVQTGGWGFPLQNFTQAGRLEDLFGQDWSGETLETADTWRKWSRKLIQGTL